MKLLNVIDKEMVDSVGEHLPPLYVVQCVCVPIVSRYVLKHLTCQTWVANALWSLVGMKQAVPPEFAAKACQPKTVDCVYLFPTGWH